MNDNTKKLILVIAYSILIAELGFAMGFDIGVKDANNKCHQQAVKHHVVEHNATTRAFEWLK